ncbi:ankyrin repeat domain-containing protein [Duganella sp. LjRoot269]|uniref:ankyrin repeat domain-containing protein n=1 Tax=Duganella sp. LjRoot269 TaxID=3342305 RepID=UPI003ECD7BE3
MKLKETYDAIKSNDTAQALFLIREDHALINAQTPFGPLLHVAAAANNLEVMRLLLDCGADVNARGGTFGGNALNYAASTGQIEAVKYLLKSGAEMDVSEPEKNPLFGAIYCGRKDIAKELIENGIRTDIRYTGESMKEMDAKAFAVERGELDIARLLDNHV